MTAQTFLGIDAGGTHTDAVLCGPEGILAGAKAPTCHEDLPSSVRAALAALEKALEERFGSEGPARLRAADRVTVGTTLAVNALVQGRADRVALALSAGPGLAPARFAIGDDVCILPGGLDHRGVEVTPLDTRPLADACAAWKKKGVRAVACVGKFSPRNAAHELAMADVVRAAGLTPVCGHSLSGELNFPRRIATAYYNAAVARIVDGFLTAVEQSLQAAGIRAPLRLLKADGGAVPAALARQEPVQSVLSGPAASVMGILALCPAVAEDACSVLLDVGGTTTDVALFAQGSPVVDRDGMSVRGRRTLVRSLASLSIGVGGDSLLGVEGQGAEARVHTGPLREGPAMAFGGTRPTLLDALNVCDRERPGSLSGDAAASLRGVAALAGEHGMEPEELAARAVADALDQVAAAVRELVDGVNARPVYTLAALRGLRDIAPERVWLVGGPAERLRERLAGRLALPVDCPPHAPVANAVGAALTLPTAGLEVYADSGRALLRVPSLELEEKLPRAATLETVKERAVALLEERLAAHDAAGARVEVVEADLFAVLDDSGRASRDMRVRCQAVPGITGQVGTAG